MKKFNFLTSLMLLWGFLANVSLNNMVFGQAPEKKDISQPEQVRPTCYSVPAPLLDQQEKTNLKQHLELLEKQFKEKKIDQKAYKQSKKNILDKMDKLKKK